MLILAVFAVALLLALALGLTTAVRSELLASRASFENAQSRFLAQAGISEARAILLYEDPIIDTLQDDWGPEAEEPLDLPMQLAGGYYRVRIYDACGRIDINAAPLDVLAKLTGDITVAQAIVDWRNRNADETYYRALAYPYLPRKGGFESPAELLLVKGVTPALYFGTPDRPGLVDLVTVASPSLDTTAEGKMRQSIASIYGMLNMAFEPAQEQQYLRQMLGNALTEYEATDFAAKLRSSQVQYNARGGFGSLVEFAQVAGLTDREVIAISDVITSRRSQPGDNNCASGRVNVNTASELVLEYLPGGSTAFAEAVIRQREKQPFQSMREVAELVFGQGGGRAAFEQGLLDRLTTKSSAYLIESMGYTGIGRGFRTLRALVFRDAVHGVIPVLQQAEEDVPLPPPDGVVTVAAPVGRRPGAS